MTTANKDLAQMLFGHSLSLKLLLKMKSTEIVIVVGVNRGGTSAVASSLVSLGFFMGDKASSPNFEDAELARLLREKDWKNFSKTVSAYAENCNLLGWKYPLSVNHLRKIDKILGPKKYIVVYRDLFAVGKRKSEVHDKNVVTSMLEANRAYHKMNTFLAKTKSPYLLVSYEKMLVETVSYASELIDFLQLDNHSKNRKAVTASIKPSPQEYVEWVNRSQVAKDLSTMGLKGFVDHLDSQKVQGWAARYAEKGRLQVEVYVNEMMVGSLEADSYREDLRSQTCEGTGNCAFDFAFNSALKNGDQVAVRESGSGLHLIGSPMVFEGPQ